MRQYRQLHGNDIVKELVEEIASTLISRLHFRCLRFQYQTVGHPVQVAAKIIREVSMKIQPDMTPYGYSILLLASELIDKDCPKVRQASLAAVPRP